MKILNEGTRYDKQASKILSDSGLLNTEEADALISKLFGKEIHAFNHSRANWLEKYLKGIARMIVEECNGNKESINAFLQESVPVFDKFLIWVLENREKIGTNIDNQFNNQMHYKDVVEKLDAIQKEAEEKAKAELGSLGSRETSNYFLDRIDSYEDFHRKYGGKATGDGSSNKYAGNGGTAWCHANSDITYNNWIEKGKYCFFVLGSKNWKDIEFNPVSNEENYKDEYGNSLIAIRVQKRNGKLENATLRCNHVWVGHTGVPQADFQYKTWEELSSLAGFDVGGAVKEELNIDTSVDTEHQKYSIVYDYPKEIEGEYGSITVYPIMSNETGELGGYVSSYDNLSQEGKCWISDESIVAGDAIVQDDAEVRGHSIVVGNVEIKSDSDVLDSYIYGVDDKITINSSSICYNSSVVGGGIYIEGESEVTDARISGNDITINSSSKINGDSYKNAKLTTKGPNGRIYISGESRIRGNVEIYAIRNVGISDSDINARSDGKVRIVDSHIGMDSVIDATENDGYVAIDNSKLKKSRIYTDANNVSTFDITDCSFYDVGLFGSGLFFETSLEYCYMDLVRCDVDIKSCDIRDCGASRGDGIEVVDKTIDIYNKIIRGEREFLEYANSARNESMNRKKKKRSGQSLAFFPDYKKGMEKLNKSLDVNVDNAECSGSSCGDSGTSVSESKDSTKEKKGYNYKGKVIVDAGDYYFVKGYKEHFPTSGEAEEFIDDLVKDESLNEALEFNGDIEIDGFEFSEYENNRTGEMEVETYYNGDWVCSCDYDGWDGLRVVDENPHYSGIINRKDVEQFGVDTFYDYCLSLKDKFEERNRNVTDPMDESLNESRNTSLEEIKEYFDSLSDSRNLPDYSEWSLKELTDYYTKLIRMLRECKRRIKEITFKDDDDFMPLVYAIAEALTNHYYNYDTYDFRDQFDSFGDGIMSIYDNFDKDTIQACIDDLNDEIEDIKSDPAYGGKPFPARPFRTKRSDYADWKKFTKFDESLNEQLDLQKLDFGAIKKEAQEIYNALYNNDDEIDYGAYGTLSTGGLCGTFDGYMSVNPEFVRLVQNYVRFSGDYLSSDRECAAFTLALDNLYPEIWDEIDKYTVNESLKESFEIPKEMFEGEPEYETDFNDDDRFSNGTLEEFNPQELMDKVATEGYSLNSVRTYGGDYYFISIHYKKFYGPRGIDNPNEEYYVDVVKEEPSGNQDRVLMEDGTADEIVAILNNWKENTIR